MKKVNRVDLLKKAITLTDGQRQSDYGKPVDNMQHIADIFNVITGGKLTARDVALVHQCTKIARRRISPTVEDHYIDDMAYCGIEFECVREGKY